MKVVLLDTKTGQKLLMDDPMLHSWAWSDGNWCCDCNRWMLFELSEEDEREHDEHEFCLGGKRFIISDAEVNHEDDWTSLTLMELNSDYPIDLLQANGVDPATVITKDHRLTPP